MVEDTFKAKGSRKERKKNEETEEMKRRNIVRVEVTCMYPQKPIVGRVIYSLKRNKNRRKCDKMSIEFENRHKNRKEEKGLMEPSLSIKRYK